MKLSVKVIPNNKGGYTAVCPTLPGCVSWGDTHEKAKENLSEAIRGYMAAMNNFVPDDLDKELIEA